MYKTYILDLLACIALLLAVVFFFRPLFYPTTGIFVTPDNYVSDATHFNYPLKTLLSRSLQHNTLPVWTNLIGTGFPLLAEAEVGTFNLVNLILFKAFTAPIAFNLGYVITFLMLGCGMYFFTRELGLSRVPSLLCGYIFMFCGFHIVQIPHFNHLQTLSYFPFIFTLWLRMIKNPTGKSWVIIPFLGAQQIFAGHYQYVFMSWLCILLFTVLWYVIQKDHVRRTLWPVITIALMLGLSAIQLVPSIEYLAHSSRSTAIKLGAVSQSGYQLSHLLQFISPYMLGDVRNGTYNLTANRTNFWESFSYIGFIPFLISMGTILWIKTNRIMKIWWILIVVFLILSMEGNSPFYLLYSLPPFSFFRINSRFIAIVTFVLVVTFGYAFEKILTWSHGKNHFSQKLLIPLIIILITSGDIWSFASTYNPVQPVLTITTPPESATTLKQFPNRRIYTLGIDRAWFNNSQRTGWLSMTPYNYLLNGLTPNGNIVYTVPHIEAYTGFVLSKKHIVNQLYLADIDIDGKAGTASFSAVGMNALRLSSANFIISTYRVLNPNVSLVHTIHPPSSLMGTNMYMYQIEDTKPPYYLARHVQILSGTREIETALDAPSWFNSFDTIMNDLPKQLQTRTLDHDTISVKTNTDTDKIFTYTSTNDSYFLLLTYFYPGWTARLDGKRIPIYGGNISSMAVFAPYGTHTVEFTFVPASLYIGAGISAAALLFYIAIIGFAYRKRV